MRAASTEVPTVGFLYAISCMGMSHRLAATMRWHRSRAVARAITRRFAACPSKSEADDAEGTLGSNDSAESDAEGRPI